MQIYTKIFKNTYRDSVLLMKIASIIRDMEGIHNAEVMIATEPNKHILKENNLFNDEIEIAGPNDLVMSVLSGNKELAQEAIKHAEELLTQGTFATERKVEIKNIDEALQNLPGANLAILSIPGAYVKKEALQALRQGLNLLVFSDNVPIEDEIEIKEMAIEKDLLVMGPDCGTAIINGNALAFANKTRKGNIGLIGASGTGLQEVSVLIHNLGLGISHAIGTGSNDISDQVGGRTLKQGLKLLEEDDNTKIIVVVSKPPGEKIIDDIISNLKRCKKPVIANFLGKFEKSFQEGNIYFTITLEETALKVNDLVGEKDNYQDLLLVSEDKKKEINEAIQKLSQEQKYIKGLFTGGTLATEACLIQKDMLDRLYSNIKLKGLESLSGSSVSGHMILDLGDDEFTVGKPHPMLEPQMRKEHILMQAKDAETAVILLDFVLGFGVHSDPVGDIINTVKKAREIAGENGRYLPIVASICGTNEDPQNKEYQLQLLKENDIIVLPTNAQAAKVACQIALKSF